MPELPEVEITARGLRAQLVGRRVDLVEVLWGRTVANLDPELLPLALLGRTLTAVGRRGKLLLLRFDDGATAAVHRRMTGNLLIRRCEEPRESHLRLVLGFDDGRELRFVDTRKFGRLAYFPDDAALDAYLRQKAGREPLDDLDATRLGALFAGRRGRLKPLLLDQRLLAGIGNLYADEILWVARLHPERAAASLTEDELALLADSIGMVLREAIDRRGTSFSDYRDADGEPGENQDHLKAYGRTGQPCPRCGTPIAKYTLGQRGTHYCPACQPRLPFRCGRGSG